MSKSAPKELEVMVDRVLKNKGTKKDKIKLLHMLYFTLAIGDALAELKGGEAVDKIWTETVERLERELCNDCKKDINELQA